MATLNVTCEVYEELKQAYLKAKKENLESFTYKGHEFLTSYAYYFLEYLKPRFETSFTQGKL